MGIAPILKDFPPMVPEVEDKEGPFSSTSVTKEAIQPANPESTERLTMLEGSNLDAGMGKATLAPFLQESIPAQTNSETAVEQLTKDQSPEAATGGTMLDQTTSEAATLDQTTSEAASGGATLDQSTSEKPVGGAELIQTPQASCANNQTPPTSPVQGATPQISHSPLVENLRTLELGNKAQVRPITTPR